MKLHYAYRGAKVIYDFFVSNKIAGTFMLPANICDSVPNTFREIGCNVLFIDINSKTLCIDERQVLNQIADCTGLLAVHTYGIQNSFDSFFTQVRTINPNAIIIDDRCLCLPDFEEEGKYDEAIADLTLFSLGDKKQVQLGAGGIGIVNDKWAIRDCCVGRTSMFENKDYTFNLNEYLHQKEIATEHITKLRNIYSKKLPNSIQLPLEFNNWRFNIRVNAGIKQTIIKNLFKHNLFASSHYKSLSINPLLDTPNAVKLQQEIINLFLDPLFYSEEQAIETCHIINETLNSLS